MDDTKDKISFSLITFVYNEAPLVEKQIRNWVSQLEKQRINYEILLVNDGSTDGTKLIVDNLSKEIPSLRVFHHDKNRGVGQAIKTVRAHVSKDYVFWNDIDSHFDLDDMDKVVPLLKNYDVLVAFKHFQTPGKKTTFSWLKSRINYYLIKILFFSNINDFQFVQFFPSVFFKDGIILESYSSFIPAEIIFKARNAGLEIGQVELFYHCDINDGRKGKCENARTIWCSIRNIFAFWFKWNFMGGKKSAYKYYQNSLGAKKVWRK